MPQRLHSIEASSPLTCTTYCSPISAKVKGAIPLILAIVIWGANWPIMKAGLSHVTPLWFSALRFALGGFCLFAWQAITRRLRLPTRRDLPLLLSVGLLQMLAFTSLGSIAMMHIPAGRSAVLAYTTPLWVTPAAMLVFHERVSGRQWVGTLLGLGGVAIMFNPLELDWHDTMLLKANAMLLAASLCWAICILHLRHYRGDSTPYQLAPWQMLLATMLLAALARSFEGPYTGDGSTALWHTALFVGPLATAFCFCAVNAASTWLSSASMATAMLAVPVVGLLASILCLGERLSAGLALGVTGVIAGIAIATLPAHKRMRH